MGANSGKSGTRNLGVVQIRLEPGNGSTVDSECVLKAGEKEAVSLSQCEGRWLQHYGWGNMGRLERSFQFSHMCLTTNLHTHPPTDPTPTTAVTVLLLGMTCTLSSSLSAFFFSFFSTLGSAASLYTEVLKNSLLAKNSADSKRKILMCSISSACNNSYNIAFKKIKKFKEKKRAFQFDLLRKLFHSNDTYQHYYCNNERLSKCLTSE